MLKCRSEWQWLTALIRIDLHNHGRWWLVPVSLMLYGMITAVNFLPLQSESYNLGDGAFLFFSNSNWRFYILNPLYLFIMSNIGNRHKYRELMLYRLGSRQRYWFGNAFVIVMFTAVYLFLIILSIEIIFIPFIAPAKQTWSALILSYYHDLPFIQNSSSAIVWWGTIWFLFLSWLGLSGVAFVTTQITNRSSLGFFTAIAINYIAIFFDGTAVPSKILQIFNISRPTLFVLHGEHAMSFVGANAYWIVWFIILISISLWHINHANGMIKNSLTRSMNSVWLIIRTLLGRIWFVVFVLAFLSYLMDLQDGIGAEIDTLNLMDVSLEPIVGLGGAPLDASLFSLVFIRWLLVFLTFLLLIGETAPHSLWQQHIMILPRLGSRWRWWSSNVTALLALSFLYLWIYISFSLLSNTGMISRQDITFYAKIFVLYWLTLTSLGCVQLLLLLLTQSRRQTLLILTIFLMSMWLVGKSVPSLLPNLPIAQTAIFAQLIVKGAIDEMGLLLWASAYFFLCVATGFLVIQRYEFTGHLKFT